MGGFHAPRNAALMQRPVRTSPVRRGALSVQRKVFRVDLLGGGHSSSTAGPDDASPSGDSSDSRYRLEAEALARELSAIRSALARLRRAADR